MTKARDISKLSAVEVDADATDTTNVTSSGALMDSELTNLAAVKAINQSLVTTASPTFAGGAMQKASSGATATSNTVLTIEDDDNTELSILGGSSSVLAINFGHSGDNDDGNINYNTTSGSEQMAFRVNAADRLTINKDGNATFTGTVTSGDLQATGLYVGSTNTSFDFYNNGTSYLNGATTVDDNLTVNGTVTASHAYVETSIVHSGDTNTSLDFNTDSQTFYAGGVRALDVNTGGVYVNSAAVDMDFRVSSDSNADMLFVDGGNDVVSIGGTTATAAFNLVGTGGSNVQIQNNIASGTGTIVSIGFINDNGLIGSIQCGGSSTSYETSSDYRLKENVDYTWDATTRLKQLKPARFNFITDDTNTLVDGFLAHEVSSIVPEAISGTKDAMAVETRYTADDVETQGDNPSKNVGDPKTYSSSKIDPQGIDQSKLVPLLVKTIQELEARITALEA